MVLGQLTEEGEGGDDCRIGVLEAVHVLKRQIENDLEGVLGASGLLIGGERGRELGVGGLRLDEEPGFAVL